MLLVEQVEYECLHVAGRKTYLHGMYFFLYFKYNYCLLYFLCTSTSSTFLGEYFYLSSFFQALKNILVPALGHSTGINLIDTIATRKMARFGS